jgi:hypothetical protein
MIEVRLLIEAGDWSLPVTDVEADCFRQAQLLLTRQTDRSWSGRPQ